MPEGKYFKIRSRLNGMVLDVFGGEASPGTKVVTWPEKDDEQGNDNQIWFCDPLNKTIRTKADPEYCLEIDEDNTLVVNPFSDSDNQKWKIAGDRIQKFVDSSIVLDIHGNEEGQEARICSYEFHGQDNQLWDFIHLPAEFFYIKSCMSGQCLDVYKADQSEGAKVVTWPKKEEEAENQLWYEDRYGYIRSKLSDMVIDASDAECGLRLKLLDNTSSRQRWARSGDKIINCDRPEEALDVYKRCDDHGAKCVAYKLHGRDNQQWEFEPCEC